MGERLEYTKHHQVSARVAKLDIIHYTYVVIKKDLTGKRFGKLVVLMEVFPEITKKYRRTPRWWSCLCDCGNIKTILQTSLVRKELSTNSCGCVFYVKKYKTRSLDNYRRLYNIWNKMCLRCTDPKQKAYPNYGGRGITVCYKWKSFEDFYNDMYSTYKPGLTIDRTDVNGNYEPSNCIWITNEDQAKNRRTTVWVEGLCAKDWCKANGVSYATFQQRRKKGLTVDEAVIYFRKMML